MDYILGFILFLIMVIVLTLGLDFINNRKVSGETAIVGTALNLFLSIVISLVLFVIIGLNDAELWFKGILNL